MKRKPIQIAAIPYTELSRETLYVLCDDGSLWRVEAPQLTTPRTWERLPDIPDAVRAPVREPLAKPARAERPTRPLGQRADLPLSPNDIRALSKVIAKPGCTAWDLRPVLRVAPNLLGMSLQRLLKQGYIAGTRKTGPFTATEAGIEKLRRDREIRGPVSAPG